MYFVLHGHVRDSHVRVSNTSLLSTADFHFSSIGSRLCCALNPFLNPHWYMERNCSKYSAIYLNKNLPYILEIFWQNTDGPVMIFFTF